MKIRNRLGYAAAYCLIILLTGCGGNHAVDSSKASTAENQMVANTPKYGTFVPNLEIVREFTQKPSWGEDVMVQSVLFSTPKRYYLGTLGQFVSLLWT
jgi:hypothetical protein